MANPPDYDRAFAPRDFFELAAAARVAAAASVQASLYGRLKRSYGGSGAGTVAWMLLHAADPDHKRHDAALAALEKRTPSELATLFQATEGAVAAARTAETKEIASRAHANVTLVVGRVRAALGRAAVAGG